MTVSAKFRFLLTTIVAMTTVMAQPSISWGQSIQLTPEQRRMINQLPPAQRQQALDAIEELQGRQQGGQPELDGQEEGLPSELDTLDEESDDELDEPEEPVAGVGSTLIISFTPPEILTGPERTELEEDAALTDLVGSGVYLVNTEGLLELPGVVDVPINGLTAEETRLRLGAEPALRLFNIEVFLLEPEQVGVEALEPFGYDVFSSEEATFDPALSGPVPQDYVLGPGDTVRIQYFGNVNGIYEFEVGRDGVLNIPELGPVPVTGLTFNDFRADLERRVSEILIGTQVSATVGELRTMRVFVLGDAIRPGSYVVSSLATISSALYAAGGISEIGSLRDIQLKRSGNLVSRFDLYDLLLEGDNSDDAPLQAGDVIFIPPVGAQVSIAGAVKRPGIYEVSAESSVQEAIAFAGGLTANAYAEGARLERIGSGAGRIVMSFDAAARGDDARSVIAGDAIIVPEVLRDYQETVQVSGHVDRPGPYQWREGIRLTDVLTTLSALRSGADRNYLLIRREAEDRSVQILSADLEAAVARPQSAANTRLEPRDRIHVFDRQYGRQRIIQPLLDELELQARYGRPNPVVSVSGTVRAPGAYPLEAGMRVSDLLRAAGDLSEEAYTVRAELVRYDVVDQEYRTTEIVNVDLAGVLNGDDASDLVLTEHDNLRISTLPEWNTLWTVSLEGEVMFPGEYRIRRGETLADILARAGGLTEAAYPEGAVFLRESLRQQEERQIELLARRLEADLASLSLQAADTSGSETLETGRELLSQLRATEPTGRLVIDLRAIAAGARMDTPIELRDSDRLLVPKIPQSVTVIGETQQNTSHVYERGLSRNDYIARSGGLTRRADRKLIYVVRASGAVEAGQRTRWFGRRRTDGTEMRPGDTIVVPLETDRIRPLTLWSSVTQILYQAAIAVAAVDTFGR